jgi:hypothetical protein
MTQFLFGFYFHKKDGQTRETFPCLTIQKILRFQPVSEVQELSTPNQAP